MRLTTVFFMILFAAALYAAEEEARRSMGFFDFWQVSRVWVSAIVCIIGLILLMRAKVTLKIRFFFMALAFFLFSIVNILPLGQFAVGMGLHPSPMCTIEKPFLFLERGRGIPLVFWSIFSSMAILSVVGNKLFCGWACPIGAIQEMIHRIPLPKRLKIILPFQVSNSIRTLMFIGFVILVFAASFSIYEYTNPFEFLHWNSIELAVFIPFLVTFIGALFIYRPFCYLICPLGLFTWVIEQFSVIRVKFDKAACTDCKLCLQKSPCPTVPAILEGKRIRPDCHACGRCIEVCQDDALKFRV